MERGMSEIKVTRPISVTVKTARSITGLGNTTIYQLIKEQKLVTTTIGRRRLISYDSLERLVNSGVDAA
jgi:excisionase family DNA binding protein